MTAERNLVPVRRSAERDLPPRPSRQSMALGVADQLTAPLVALSNLNLGCRSNGLPNFPHCIQAEVSVDHQT